MSQTTWAYVPVEIAGYRVAIPVHNVLAVKTLQELQIASDNVENPVEDTPVVEQLRLIDIRILLDAAFVPNDRSLCVVIDTDGDDGTFGLLVDVVHAVESVTGDRLLDLPQVLSSVATVFSSVVRTDDSVVLVLAINKLTRLSDDIVKLVQVRDSRAA